MSHFLSRLIGIIFGLVFAGGGIFLLFQTSVPTFQSWKEMRVWQPAEAELLSVGGTESSTTATYRYIYFGTVYQNTRVYVASFNDSIGSYHQHLRSKLQRLHRQNRLVAIWLNPLNPQDAVVDRDMRWGLFTLVTTFCSIFLGVGFLIIWSVFRSSDASSKLTPNTKQALRREWFINRQNPNFSESFNEFKHQTSKTSELHGSGSDPWPRNSEWQKRQGWETARIRSDAKSSARFMWFFAILWNGISLPILFAFSREWQSGNYAIAIALLFPLTGAWLLYKAISLSREFHRFGIVELSMDPYPGSIGGQMGGTLELKNVYQKSGVYRVELECVFSYMSGSGNDRSRRENIKWAEAGSPASSRTSTGTQLSFRFNIPEDLPEADIIQTGDYYFWRCTITAEITGVNFNRSYNIPVFATAVQSQSIHHDISQQANERRKETAARHKMAVSRGKFEDTPLARAVRLQKRDRELSLYFPMFRNKMLTVFALVFGGGFGFATYGIITTFGSTTLFNILTLLFSLPFGLVALLSTIAAVYLPLNNLKVTISRGQVHIRRRLFLFPVYIKTFYGKDLKEIIIKQSGSTGQGTRKVVHYKLLARTTHGNSCTIAEDIDGEGLANQLREYLQQRIRSGY
jgi:hypothetical protein